MGGRNKSKKFLKQKQGNQKKRPKFQTKTPESIAKKEALNQSVSDLTTISQVESISNNKNEFDIHCDSNITSSISEIIANENSSIASFEFEPKSNAISITNFAELLDEHMQNLQEKDAIMRETTLHRINRILRQNTECDSYLRAKSCEKLQTLSMCLRECLHHGESKQQCVALETISLLMLTLQQDWHILEQNVCATIIKLIENPLCVDLKLQIQSLKTLCCMMWVLNDASTKQNAINIFEKIWSQRVSNTLIESVTDTIDTISERKNEDCKELNENKTELLVTDNINEMDENEMRDDTDSETNEKEIEPIEKVTNKWNDEMKELLDIEAVSCWNWLVASIGNDEAIGSLLEEYYKQFIDILEHNDSIELRCIAGEALTLLLSNYKNAKLESKKVDLDEIECIFYELSQECDIKRKNGLKEQKYKFGLYLDCFETGYMPRVKIKLKGKDYELKGWNKWIIYDKIKNILKDGLQIHLLKNEMIQAVFDMHNVNASKQLTQVEKKCKLMEHEDNAKQKKQQIKGQRQQKQAFIFNHGTE